MAGECIRNIFMSESRTKNTIRNLYWGTWAKFISILIPFITRTAMIYVLGMRYIGLDSLFVAVLNVLSLAEAGFGEALVFSMYEPMAKHDAKAVNALLAFYRKCYRVIGIVILGMGICMLPFLDFLVKGDVPIEVDIRILFCIHLLNTVIGYFIYGYSGSIFRAQQRVDISKRIILLIKIVSGIIQTILLIACRNYYVYILVGPLATIAQNLLIANVAKKQYPEFYCEGMIKGDEKKEIQNKVAGLVFQKIGNIVLSSVDTVVISTFLGLEVLGIYNGYYYVIIALVGFITVIEDAMIPSIGNSIVMEDKEKNYSDFRKFHFMIIWILTWWSACLLCLFQPFMELWQGKENMLSFGMVVLFSLYFYLHHAGDITYMYKEAAGIWWEGRYYSLLAAIENLILNIILVQIMGLSGILVSTIVAIITVHTPYGSWILFKHYLGVEKKYALYLKRMFLYLVIAILISFFTYVVCITVPIKNLWIQLLIRGGICIIFPNLIFIACYWRLDDFQETWKYVTRILRKKE